MFRFYTSWGVVGGGGDGGGGVKPPLNLYISLTDKNNLLCFGNPNKRLAILRRCRQIEFCLLVTQPWE
jgi:hypothetical protein